MKIYLTLLMLYVSVFSFAQMRVEDIKTEKDAVKFLDTYYFKGNRDDTVVTFKRAIDTSKIYYIDSFVAKYLDSANYLNWIKGYFNKDKKSDLIICCFFNEESRILSFISKKKAEYEIVELSNQADRDGVHFVYSLNEKHIVLGRVDCEVNQWDSSYHFFDRFKRDTIEYRDVFRGFTDYRYYQKPVFSIDTLKFKLGSFKRYFNDDLIISSDGYMKRVQVKPISESKGAKFISEKYLSKDSTKRLFDYINKMPLDKYDSAFTSITKYWLDGMWVNTSFIDKSGFQIGFTDFLETGPLGFQRLYDLIMDIRRSKDWNVIETIEMK